MTALKQELLDKFEMGKDVVTKGDISISIHFSFQSSNNQMFTHLTFEQVKPVHPCLNPRITLSKKEGTDPMLLARQILAQWTGSGGHYIYGNADWYMALESDEMKEFAKLCKSLTDRAKKVIKSPESVSRRSKIMLDETHKEVETRGAEIHRWLTTFYARIQREGVEHNQAALEDELMLKFLRGLNPSVEVLQRALDNYSVHKIVDG